MSTELETITLRVPPFDAMVEHLREELDKFEAHTGMDDPAEYLRDYCEVDPGGGEYAGYRPDHLYLAVCNDLEIEPRWLWINDLQKWVSPESREEMTFG